MITWHRKVLMICGRRAADWRNAMLMTSLSACSVPARNTWLPLRSVHEVRATQAGNAHCGFGQPNTSAHQRYAQRRRIKNESGWLKLQDWTLTDELARLATEWKSSQGMKFCNLSSVSCPHIRPSMSCPAISSFPILRVFVAAISGWPNRIFAKMTCLTSENKEFYSLPRIRSWLRYVKIHSSISINIDAMTQAYRYRPTAEFASYSKMISPARPIFMKFGDDVTLAQ